jgi:hypothetical protein
MNKKMYSAFISSVYESLQDERSVVIDCLLDFQIFPICMEHFTVSSSEGFAEIKKFIDNSDFVVLILGSKYGSCDENGVSWTEREFDYATQKRKKLMAIVCNDLIELEKKPESDLSNDEKKQIAFRKRVDMAHKAKDENDIRKIVTQFFGGLNFGEFVGWTRGEDYSGDKLENWKKENARFDLGGVWYHFHTSWSDESYLRVGTVKINQEFDPKHYDRITIDGNNYSVSSYDAENHRFTENKIKYTNWNGEYSIGEDGHILGIYHAFRKFQDKFNEQSIGRGENRGIHDFFIEDDGGELRFIQGEFHDQAPSPKEGNVFLFRTEEERIKFLEENFPHLLG